MIMNIPCHKCRSFFRLNRKCIIKTLFCRYFLIFMTKVTTTLPHKGITMMTDGDREIRHCTLCALSLFFFSWYLVLRFSIRISPLPLKVLFKGRVIFNAHNVSCAFGGGIWMSHKHFCPDSFSSPLSQHICQHTTHKYGSYDREEREISAEM